MAKKWVFPPENRDRIRRLASALHVGETTARLLANRGISDPADAQRFLQPTLNELHDPCENPAVTEAAEFLRAAVDEGRPITIYGDYDADGICAVALLLRCFGFLDAEAGLYIPHRVDEGYGLSCDAIRELADSGTEVIVTVDCGVSAFEEVELARRLGMELVITDHHEPRDGHPEAAHVLDPKLPDCRLGYENLAGVGVAFKLVWAVGQQLSEGHRVSEEFKDLLMEALSLVAIGTIADVVPLVDENRVLAHYGLKTLGACTSPGLRVLLAGSRVRGGRVSARDVGFRIAPRLNAAGRMGDARAAVELLVTEDELQAADLAEHLEDMNRLRRNVQAQALRQARERLAESGQLERPGCIVLTSPDWHLGVVGLVASRLAETFARPAFVFAAEDQMARGSGRSIPGFPLFEAVRRCADLLERFGGHKGAAGLSLLLDRLPAFTERMNGLLAEAMGAGLPVPELAVDGRVELSALDPGLVREMELLEPFGPGNPEPIFAASELRLAGNPQIVGSTGRHLAFLVRQERTTLRVIAMGKADWLDELRARRDAPFSLAFQPAIDTYRGTMAVELRAEDIRWDGVHAEDS